MPSSFTEDFEGATYTSSPTETEISGFVTMPSTEKTHGGNQSVKFTSTNTAASKQVGLNYDFGSLKYGTTSVWVFDTGADIASGNQLWFSMSNSVTSQGMLLAVPDYDLGPNTGGSYYWDVQGASAYTGIDRTQAWHKFEVEHLPTGLTLRVDGQTVYSNIVATAFDKVFFKMVAPSWRPAMSSYWDDFSFEEYNPNQPPDLNPIGDRSVNEGSTLSFAAVATDPNAGDSLTYSLDPGAPSGASIDPATGQFSYFAADGPGTAQVTVRVTDSGNPALSDTETIAITVNNLAPTATGITGPSVVAENEDVDLILTASDPSAVDQAAGFDWKLDLNDDGIVDETVNGASGMTVSRQFTPGLHTIRATAVDKDGGVGPESTHTIRVGQAFVVAGSLHVYGTPEDDEIRIFKQGAELRVKINGEVIGTFSAIDKIKAYGGDGDDRIWSNSKLPREFYGENGNDTLLGGLANDLLDGGLGYLDRLIGGGGDDELNDADGVARAVGGNGADKITVSFAPDWNLNGNLKLPVGAVAGGAGDDQIKITANNAALEFALSGNAGNDNFELDGTWGLARILGMAGTDTLENLGVGLIDFKGIEA